MKKLILIFVLILGVASVGIAQQRYVFVDTEYILNQMPEYQMAQDNLNQQAKRYQEEIDKLYTEIRKMKDDTESKQLFLSTEMREKRLKSIKKKEFKAKKLQQKYFGTNGDLYKKRRSLIQPIQEKIYQAVEELARKGNYGMVIDQSASPVILWSQPKYDKSDKILEMILGQKQ